MDLSHADLWFTLQACSLIELGLSKSSPLETVSHTWSSDRQAFRACVFTFVFLVSKTIWCGSHAKTWLVCLFVLNHLLFARAQCRDSHLSGKLRDPPVKFQKPNRRLTSQFWRKLFSEEVPTWDDFFPFLVWDHSKIFSEMVQK